MKKMGYEFCCKSCKSLLAIDVNSRKIKEVMDEGDVLIKCPNCWTMALYDKIDFREVKDISEWGEEALI